MVKRAAWLAVAAVLAAGVSQAQETLRFTCDGKGGMALAADTRFSDPGGTKLAQDGLPAFGFDLVASPTRFTHGSCSADAPFFFSVAEPDGNYQVTVVLGSAERSVVTVRAESRRLMVAPVAIAAGGSSTQVFNVNVRTAPIAGDVGGTVKLKPREIGALDWDGKLTLEFNGTHPRVRSIAIRPIADVPVLYLAGDSTVVDQDKEPWAAWGQMLPVFFGTGIVVANEAESGETIRSFTGERRFDKILSTIKPGDFLMIQFAHNDQKNGTPEQTDFAGYLRRYVETVRRRGATPILVTSMNRRVFDAAGKITDTLGGYPQAMRAFAAENHVALIDLNALSKTLFEAMGVDGTLRAFVHYPAGTFPDQPEELKDDTHFNAYGAYELAQALVESIREQGLPLARFLRPGIAAFDPAHPEPVGAVAWPPSPLISAEKPYGK